MRARIFLALALFLLALFVVRSFAQEKSDAAAIRALESKWVDAYKQRQIATVASLLAEDYVITQEDGSVYGKVGFISYNAGSLRVEIAEASDLRIHMHDNIAVVTGAYHEKRRARRKALRLPRPPNRRLDEDRRQMAAHRLPLQPARKSLAQPWKLTKTRREPNSVSSSRRALSNFRKSSSSREPEVY